MSTPIKLLVIGYSGQLAKSLASLKSAHPRLNIVCVGRPELDLCDPSSVDAVFKKEQPNVVINAAAYTAVDKAESEVDHARAINAVGVKHLAESCLAHGAKLVHISTDYVFDGQGSVPLLETDPVSPIGVYGQTKLEGEQLALSVLPSSVIIRTSWVYGDEGNKGNNFVTTMLRLAESRDTLGVVGDQFGRPTYASDLAQAILQIVPQLDDASGGVYHFSNDGETTSWHGFAEEIFKQAAKRGLKAPKVLNSITTAEYPTPAARPAWSVLSLNKIQETFSVNIPSWKDSLNTYFNKR